MDPMGRSPTRFEGHPRNVTRTDQMRKACEGITRRKIQRNGKTLRFEVVDPDEDGGRSAMMPAGVPG